MDEIEVVLAIVEMDSEKSKILSIKIIYFTSIRMFGIFKTLLKMVML